MKHVEKLDRYIRAKFPVIGITSHEEGRVMAAIDALAAKRGRKVATWSYTKGCEGVDVISPDETVDPGYALQSISTFIQSDLGDQQPYIFVLFDLHNMLQDALVVRHLRDIVTCASYHTVILLSPAMKVPADLEKGITLIDWPLPSFDELASILLKVENGLPESVKITLNGNREDLVASLQGLTAFEAENAILASVAATRELGDSIIPMIVQEKANIIKQTPGLEYYPVQDGIKAGGLGKLDEYTAVKMATFSAKAKQAGVDPAKGVVLVGIPGTGKSLSAKVIAGGRLPLLRLDIGAIMGSLVGQSEANLRQSFKVAEAVAPAVLWIDEIEKGLGGIGDNDGGTTVRVLGTMLTWMQETTAPIYMVATANDVRSLKPELLRRFDDIFFVGLPDHAGRLDILDIHLSKRGYDSTGIDGDTVAQATWGYTGGEIEKVVKAAIEAAFFKGDELSTGHLLAAAGEIIPISQTSEDKINELQSWAKGRARAAGPAIEDKPKVSQVRQLEI